jgi:DNA-directed RNA polymerase sigma subunit (sigma70/sigma32)
MANEGQRAWNERGPGWRVHNHVKGKLTPKQRDEIVARYREGGEGNTAEELAVEFGVSAATVRGMGTRR